MCESTLVSSRRSVQCELVTWWRPISASDPCPSFGTGSSRAERLRASGSIGSIGFLACTLSACLGGQTGTEERRGTGTATENGCFEEPRELKLGEISPLGFSANEVMATALGMHAVELVWQASDASFSFGPERGLATLQLTLSSSASSARFVHYARSALPEQQALGCPPDEVQIAVRARLETSGGALSEEFPVALSAVSVASSRFAVDLPLGALSGSFTVTPSSGFSTRALSIHVELDERGPSGSFGGLFEQSSGGLSSARPVTYACFPAGAANCALP